MKMQPVLHNQRGFALLSVFMLLLLALALGAATMLFTLLDFKATAHFTTGNQALAASEAGILDALNTINKRGVVNFQNDVITAGLVPTPSTNVNGYSTINYQLSITTPTGGNVGLDGQITSTGNQTTLSAQRVVQVKLTRDKLQGGPGALHLSDNAAVGTFGGNSMTIDGNNWLVQDVTTNPVTATPDPSVEMRPAVSTRNDTVTSQVISSMAGLGTVIGLGCPGPSPCSSSPSVYTTGAASTADLNRFVQDILSNNGAAAGCSSVNGGGKDFWLGNVHCISQTNGNNSGKVDTWGTLTPTQSVLNVTYVTDPTAKLVGGSSGAGILIFDSNQVGFGGNFGFCGWVLFKQTNANITIQGTPEIYGEVLSPLPSNTGGGSLTIRYSQDCLIKADAAGSGINGPGNLPHPMKIVNWSEP